MRGWVDATCRADAQTLSQLLSADAVTIDEPGNMRAFGPRGYLDYVTNWGKAFAMEITLGSLRRAEPGIWDASFAVHLVHVGTFTTRWGDAAPTGRQFDLVINERCRVVNGHITELRVIYNLLALLRAIGIEPQRPRSDGDPG